MAPKKLQSSVWALAREQHGVVTRAQLIGLGYGSEVIRHRLRGGRLHRVRRGVYAIGRPELSRLGVWMAAVLSCGPRALLSHESAAALWGIRPGGGRLIEVSVPNRVLRRRAGIVVHRRSGLSLDDLAIHRAISVTSPVCTIVDLSARLSPRKLEAMVNEADKLDIVDPERLRQALEDRAGRPGVAVLRGLLDRQTFTLTDSALERLFLPIARRAGLPPPLTSQMVNGFKVDSYWPALALVVETDGLRYHPTPAQQARDRLRDQAHLTAGLRPLRFTHGQVKFEPAYVQAVLAAVVPLPPPRSGPGP
jgi:very-short-patch-repair endonuclease